MIPSSYREWIEDEARKERAADERERLDRFVPVIPEPREIAMDNTQLNEVIRYHEYQEKFWGNGSTTAKFHASAVQMLQGKMKNLQTDWMRENLRRIKAVEAVRGLLDCAEYGLSEMVRQAEHPKTLLIGDWAQEKLARWSDAIAAGKAVLETPEKRDG